MKSIDLFNVPYMLEGVWHLIAHPVSQAAKDFCRSRVVGEWINDALVVSGEANLSSFLQSIPETLATITM